MKKTLLAVIVCAVIIACASCASENLEGLEEFEGIYHPVAFGYNIDLKRGDNVYTPYASATGADETYADLDFPQGDRIGFLRTNNNFQNEIFWIYEVEGYSPDEWLYMFIGADGSRGISLYKAENVTDIPGHFEQLRADQEFVADDTDIAEDSPGLEDSPSITDAARFAAEYMEHNGQLRGNGEPHFILDISEDNPVIYLEAGEIISKLESGTGIINLGFPTCPWCREIVPHLIELAEQENVPLYYMNIQPIRDVRELDESGEIITATEGTPEYHRMVEILYDWLWEYAGLENPKIKRIYVPTTIFVRDGEILYVHIATLRENYEGGYQPLNDQQLERVTGYLTDAMMQIFKSADNGVDGGCDDCP